MHGLNEISFVCVVQRHLSTESRTICFDLGGLPIAELHIRMAGV